VYEVPSDPNERPGCRDALVITRAVFGVILPPLIAMLALLVMIALCVYAYAIAPALALLPLAAIAVGVVLFIRWERGQGPQGPPPEF
jgi:hypothetical protein